MGAGGYERRHQFFHQKGIFLPMLCRTSARDVVKLSHYKDSFSEDPSSPKVSCMGQVKRSNRVIAFPTTYRFSSNATTPATSKPVTNHQNGALKYTKLKKLFSSKNLTAPTTTTASAPVSASFRGSKSCVVSRRETCTRSYKGVKGGKSDDQCGGKVEVNVDELDPPLPVVKTVKPPAGEVNLWKRRFGGETLASLQIQQVHLPSSKLLPPPTV